MIKKLAIIFVLTFCAPTLAAEPQTAERLAQEQLARKVDEAWTAGDVDANAALFTADATGRLGDDPLGEGREALRAQFRSFFKDRPAGLRHVTNIERIDQLTPDLAMWDAKVSIERLQPSGSWSVANGFQSVVVTVREPSGWRIRTIRGFPVPAKAPAKR